jgi:hypothetical protein
MSGKLGVGLIYLGSVNAVFATGAGTCTGGSADELTGGIITLFFYLVALALFSLREVRRNTLMYLLPLSPLLLYQTYFSVHLAYGYFVQGVSACAILQNDGEYEFDGREIFFANLWLLVSLVLLSALVVAFSRRSR